MLSLLLLAAAVSSPVYTHPIDGSDVDRPYTTVCPHTDPISKQESDVCETPPKDPGFFYVFEAEICGNPEHECVEARIRPGAPQEVIDYAIMVSVMEVQYSTYPHKICFPDVVWSLISLPLKTALLSDHYKFAKTRDDLWCSPNELGGRP